MTKKKIRVPLTTKSADPKEKKAFQAAFEGKGDTRCGELDHNVKRKEILATKSLSLEPGEAIIGGCRKGEGEKKGSVRKDSWGEKTTG